MPNFLDGWPRLFYQGLLANMQERVFAAAGWPELCPVLFSIPWGFLVVMPRLRELTDDEFLEFDSKVWADRGDYVIPVEHKTNSFGWQGDKIVAIDYGN